MRTALKRLILMRGADGISIVPSQSFQEMLTNGNFDTWSGDNPTGFAVSGESGGNIITQTAPDGSAGTGAATWTTVATIVSLEAVNALVAGGYAEVTTTVSAWSSGRLDIYDAAGANLVSVASLPSTPMKTLARWNNATMRWTSRTDSNLNVTLNSVSVQRVTLSPQQTAASANHRATFTYTLPGSPVNGTTVWLMPRISDFTAGNYWLAWLRYTGTQWDINLYSVATHSRTSRTSATNIGATVGLRVNCNGNTLRMETTADGNSWTQRGVDVANSTYNTATGVNVLYSSDVTPTLLTVTAAV